MNTKIRVAIRVRPSNDDKGIYDINKDTNEIYFIEKPNDIYRFDHVYGPDSKTGDIYYESVKDVVMETIEGKNSTIIAYGSTGSGKTYTMTGDAKHTGIITFAVQDIFQTIGQDMTRHYGVRISYFEIYNEKIIDLLASRTTVKSAATLSSFYVENSTNLLSIYATKSDERATASTKENDRSSRSHAILRITIESTKDNGSSLISHLDLVDLAGSECQERTNATGERQREGSNINKSLLALTKLIYSAANKKPDAKQITNRDSKLTLVLADSIGGNSKTVIITTLANETVHASTSYSSIMFALNAMKITNKPKVNEVQENNVNKLRKRIKELEQELLDMKNNAAQANLFVATDPALKRKRDELTTLLNMTLGGQVEQERTQFAIPENRGTQAAKTIEKLKFIDELHLGTDDIMADEDETLWQESEPAQLPKRKKKLSKKLFNLDNDELSERKETKNLTQIQTSPINTELQKENEAMKEEIRKLKEEMEELKKEREDIEEIKREKEEIAERFSNLQAEESYKEMVLIDGLKSQISKQKEEIAMKEKKIAEIKNEMKDKIAQIQKDCNNKINEKELECENQIELHITKIDELNGEIYDLKTTNRGMEVGFNALQESLKIAQQKLVTSEKEVTNLSRRLQWLNDDREVSRRLVIARMKDSPYECNVLIDCKPAQKTETFTQIDDEKADLCVENSSTFEELMKVDYTYIKKTSVEIQIYRIITFIILVVQILFIYSVVML